MERTDILELMSTLKLFGMRAAYDEVMATGIKRRHEPPRIVGDLLSAEIAEKQARSIKYQLTIAKLPLAKDIDDLNRAMSGVQPPRTRPDRAFARGGRIDQGSRAKIRDRLSRLASSLAGTTFRRKPAQGTSRAPGLTVIAWPEQHRRVPQHEAREGGNP
jgi:hypothetical protein